MKTETSLLIALALVSLLAVACAAPQAAAPTTPVPAPVVQNTAPAPTLTNTPVPTATQAAAANTATIPLPTPVPFPTPSPSGLTIRMSAGDKCTLEGPQSIPTGFDSVQWIVESKEHEQYGLAMASLNPGKTMDDVRALPPTYLDPPMFAQWTGQIFQSEPGNNQQVVFSVPKVAGNYYFACFYRFPSTRFGDVGPVKVKE